VAARIAVVVAGAGARGAYEAGVLGELVPRMEQAGAPPDTFVGTSAGALNAVVLAAFAGGPPPNAPPELALDTATDALRVFWRQLRAHQVWRPLLRDAPRVLWYYGGGGIIRGGGLTSLLHTGPLSRTAERWSWALDAAREKIATGRVKALAVATTDVYRGRTVVFVERAPGVALPPADAKRGIDYVATELTTDHLVASAAIPVAFPADGRCPTRAAAAAGTPTAACVSTRRSNPRWRSVRIGWWSWPPTPPKPWTRPRRPATISSRRWTTSSSTCWRPCSSTGWSRTSRRCGRSTRRCVRRRRPLPPPAGADGRPGSGRPRRYREFPHVFVGPRSRDTLGKLADDVFRGLGPLRRLQPDVADLAVLRRLLASGEGPRPGDPLSYLFFHPTFAKAAFALGTDDAAEVVPPGVTAVPWST
jgi:NTE family protein